jgi:NAD(P)H-hydrate repair Nnr-like enzyme with NAD(P)H-hydrate epimerase domain
MMGLKFVDAFPEDADKSFSVVIDALFGFSFKPPVRSGGRSN